MKLIFDLTKTQPLGDSKFHGGGKYGEIVFKALVEQSEDIIAYYNSTKWLNPFILALCQEHNVLMFDSNDHSLKDVVEKFQGVIYSPLLQKDIEAIGSNTYICTVHGLRTLEMPYDEYRSKYENGRLGLLYTIYRFFKTRRVNKKELERYRTVCSKNNVHVITVSEHSKASMLSFIPRLKSKDMKVFYSPSTAVECDLIERKRNNKKYYLLVSAHRWVKNSLRAIKAFDELFSDFPELDGEVVLTGVKDRRVFEQGLKNPSRFKYLNYVEDDELLKLFQGAFLFVYPTLNEGFGYPPLESMCYGTPVIASAISSIPEICGDAVLYFNPYLISEIKMRILQMEDHDVRNHYIEKGFARFKLIEERQRYDLSCLVKYLLSFVKNN